MTDATRAGLVALAERCEAADGPDDVLELDIARAVGWEQDPERPQYWRHVSAPSAWRMFPPPAYTASLDAALTLVKRGRVKMVVGENCSSAEIVTGWGVSRQRHLAAPIERPDDEIALCVCAAALRARASEAPR